MQQKTIFNKAMYNILNIFWIIVILVFLLLLNMERYGFLMPIRNVDKPTVISNGGVYLVEYSSKGGNRFVEVPITFIDSLRTDRGVDKVIFYAGEYTFEDDPDILAFGSPPFYYRGSHYFYPNEIFDSGYAIRKQSLFFTLPEEILDEEVSRLEITGLHLVFDDGAEVSVDFEKGHITFDADGTENLIDENIMEIIRIEEHRTAILESSFTEENCGKSQFNIRKLKEYIADKN